MAYFLVKDEIYWHIDLFIHSFMAFVRCQVSASVCVCVSLFLANFIYVLTFSTSDRHLARMCEKSFKNEYDEGPTNEKRH